MKTVDKKLNLCKSKLLRALLLVPLCVELAINYNSEVETTARKLRLVFRVGYALYVKIILMMSFSNVQRHCS